MITAYKFAQDWHSVFKSGMCNLGTVKSISPIQTLFTWGEGRAGRLGHGGNIRRLVPTIVPRARFHGLRIGRCHLLPREHTRAFLMGMTKQSHGRVTVKKLVDNNHLARIICSWCAVLPGMAGRMEGLMRLCGGFDAWRQQRVLGVN